jgi:hypothetical protein
VSIRNNARRFKRSGRAARTVRPSVESIDSYAVAQAWFAEVSTPARPTCPPYTDGDGADIF